MEDGVSFIEIINPERLVYTNRKKFNKLLLQRCMLYNKMLNLATKNKSRLYKIYENNRICLNNVTENRFYFDNFQYKYFELLGNVGGLDVSEVVKTESLELNLLAIKILNLHVDGLLKLA
jgi:hypothetical protein